MMALCLLQTAVWAAGAPLRLAVGMAKPPYVEGNGSRGLEVDIVLAALREAGISVQVQQMPQARGLQSVLNGNVDAMITLVPNAAPSLYFSRPVVQYRNRAITLASSHITLNYLSDLSHYRVASFQNATYLLGYGFSKAVESAPFYAEYADQETLNRLLFNKRVDVVVGDEWVFHSYATRPARAA
ncbi:substrate-binding periplasmic protein [Paludibacterium denitrificans]|nr:transporter substrate-binding domain-containing protein [Paludibacterium denitrificans]